MRTTRSEPKERAAADVSQFSLRLYTITARHTPGINQGEKVPLKTKPNHHAVALIGFSQVCTLLSLPSVLQSIALCFMCKTEASLD